MNYYPIFLNLNSKHVLLVGGGRIAARKLKSLVSAGALVSIVSPAISNEIIIQLPHPKVQIINRFFNPNDLRKVWLVICATNDILLNQKIAKAAELARIFVNVVDSLPLCSFIVPSLIKRGKLNIAISTSGAAPAISRRLRERLEIEFGPEWSPFLNLMQSLRTKIMTQGKLNKKKRNLFFALADSDLFQRMLMHNYDGVDEILNKLLGPNYTLTKLGFNFQNFKPQNKT